MDRRGALAPLAAPVQPDPDGPRDRAAPRQGSRLPPAAADRSGGSCSARVSTCQPTPRRTPAPRGRHGRRDPPAVRACVAGSATPGRLACAERAVCRRLGHGLTRDREGPVLALTGVCMIRQSRLSQSGSPARWSWAPQPASCCDSRPFSAALIVGPAWRLGRARHRRPAVWPAVGGARGNGRRPWHRRRAGRSAARGRGAGPRRARRR